MFSGEDPIPESSPPLLPSISSFLFCADVVGQEERLECLDANRNLFISAKLSPMYGDVVGELSLEIGALIFSGKDPGFRKSRSSFRFIISAWIGLNSVLEQEYLRSSFINRGMEFVLAMSCLGSFSNIAPLPLASLNSFAPLSLASLNSFDPLHIGDCSFSSSDISKLLSYEDSLEMFIVSRLLLSGVGRLGLDKFAPMPVASLNNLATADNGDSSSTSDLLSYEDLLEIL